MHRPKMHGEAMGVVHASEYLERERCPRLTFIGRSDRKFTLLAAA